MLKSFLLSLGLLVAAALPLPASISIIQPHHVFVVPADGIFPATICEYYFPVDGHAYSLVEDRLGTLYFYDFGGQGYWGHCRSDSWPYSHVVFDLGTESEAQPLVPASPPLGFAPAAEGSRVIFNSSVTPPTEHQVAASANSLSVSFPRRAGRRYSVETSRDGRAWTSVGQEWFVPARRNDSRTVTIPLGSAVKYYRVRRVL